MARRYGATVVPLRTARAARRDAALAGSDTAPYHGGCESPVWLPVVGMRDRSLVAIHESDWDYAEGYGVLLEEGVPLPDYMKVQHAGLTVRCRRCPWCLKQRGKEWAARSVQEIGKAQRTWFVTLTLTPQAQFQALAEARNLAKHRCVDLEEMDEAYIFRHRVSVIGAELTRWVKRVRKNSGSRLRYALVAEAHKSGDPHFHALVHECLGSSPLTWRHLTDAWKWGFSSAKLVKHEEAGKAAWYTSKYLAKSALARMRASARYGRPS